MEGACGVRDPLRSATGYAGKVTVGESKGVGGSHSSGWWQVGNVHGSDWRVMMRCRVREAHLRSWKHRVGFPLLILYRAFLFFVVAGKEGIS